jgi:SAM-dependent methyltransferase
MHPTAFNNCQKFKAAYESSIKQINNDFNIVEIGSQDVNGSLRQLWPDTQYTGIDFVNGKGVDIILDDPYKLPLENESVDVILSSSVFEHSEMFWVLYLEIMRVLKPHGLFYLNVPSNGDFHRWPVDCYRFYPDSGRGLVTWGKYNGLNCGLLESYISSQSKNDQWNDFVAVFVKDNEFASNYTNRILDNPAGLWNGIKHATDSVPTTSDFVNFSQMSEDQKKLNVITQIVNNSIRVN